MATENKKYIPALRFPEFQNDGEWKIVLLKDFTERIKSKVGNAQLRPISISAGIGFVDQKNKFGRDISGNQYSNYIVLKKGEFAYNKGNSIKYPQGCVYQLKEFEIVACPNVFVCFRIINNSVCPDFMSAYFASNYHGKQLKQYITSGVRSNGLLNISAETFLGIKTPLPSPAEQKKIADCLSSLDKYIDATKCKLELLKEHKKGLMQRLFPAKGKTTPELRFPEFQNDGEWQIVSLGEITSVVNRRNKSNCSLPIYSINNAEGFVPQSQQFAGMDSEARGYDISAYKIIGKHTFAYNPARINVGSIGYSGELKDILISSLYVCFKTMDNVDDDFIMCFFNSYIFNQAVESNVEGGIRSYLFYENFSRINIAIPSLYEQKRIASCIMSIDCEIKKINDKIDLLETHKKGLQQQLFPRFK